MSPNDPAPQAGPASAPQPIVIDDLGRFADTAGAFRSARERVRAVRGPFTAAGGAGDALGDSHLTAQYDETFRRMVGALDAIEGCFEQFFDALSAAGNSYQQADDSVAGHIR
jgi:uncharacterized protein YukE